MGDLLNLKRNVATSMDLADGPFLGFFPSGGTKYYLDPTNGSDGNSGTKPDEAFASLSVAYAALTAGQHDVLFYIAGSSSISLSSAFTWAKSYTHFIGVCADTLVSPRARLFQTSTATDVSPLVTVSGSGCYWANIEVFQGVDDDGSLIAVTVSGGRNVFQNCMFAGAGNATQAAEANARSLTLGGEENTFRNCYIGLDTVPRTAANACVEWTGSSAARNAFDNCVFRSYATGSGSGHRFLKFGNGCLGGGMALFRGCIFFNDPANIKTSAVGLTYAIDGHATPNGVAAFDPLCMFIGCDDITDDATGIFMLGASSDDYSDYSAGLGLAAQPT